MSEHELHPQLKMVVDAIRASKAPGDMTTRVVAVDGHGGSGKTSLAGLLAGILDAPVVRTDDFASWDNPVDWWPGLIEQVLSPLAVGRRGRYQPTSWGGPEKDPVVVEPTDIVLLEGVTASRESFRPYLAYSIWVETPRELCLQRGLERDGAAALDDWQRWLAGEDAYIARERPADRADVVLRGDADLWA